MKKLQCEICGGQLMMKDGIAECQSCGMQFSKEEVKKMVVELSGPIKIDGEVKVSGVDDADTFYQRAQGFERMGEHFQAGEVYEEMLQKYPLDGRARLGCCIAEWKRAQAGVYAKHLPDSWWKERVHTSQWVSDMEKQFEQAISLLTEPNQISDANIKRDAFRSWVQEEHARREKEQQQAAAEKARAEQERLQKKEAEKAEWLEQERLWATRNAEFLNQFEPAVIERRFSGYAGSRMFLRQIVQSIGATPSGLVHPEEIKKLSFTYAFDNEFRGYCVYQNNSPLKKARKKFEGTFVLKGMHSNVGSGDIRPSMDGYEIKTLFGKKVYRYDPNKL